MQSELKGGESTEQAKLSSIPVGEAGIISDLSLEGTIRNYVMRYGLVPGAVVLVVRNVPLGGLRIYRVGQSEIALRPETAEHILVKWTQR